MADLYNYIFQFPDEGSAQRDSVLGPYFGSLVLPNPVEILIWPNTLINSVTPQPGFWFMITKLGPIDESLEDHPNLQILNDQTLMTQAAQGVISVILPNQTEQNPQFPLPLFNTNIVFSNYGPQFTGGLISQLPPPNPVPPPPPPPPPPHFAINEMPVIYRRHSLTFRVAPILVPTPH